MIHTIRGRSRNALRRIARTLLLALIVLLVMFSIRSRNPSPSIVRGAATPDARIDPAAIDAFIVANLERTGLPGVALAIIRDDTVVYSAGYGHDSAGAPITPATPLYIGSLSKSITALAVMQLVDQGRVDLDAPVQRYLPEFAPADPRAGRITVRQLLDQTSGLADAGFPEMELPQPDSLQGAVARMRTARLAADPGTQFNYHNPNYHVAARLVEVVSGQPFADYLRQRVFEPLGMSASLTVDRADAPQPGVANGYVLAYGRTIARPMLPHFANGSGGVISTAQDLARWLMLQNNAGAASNGRQIVSARSIDVMHTPSSVSGDYAMGWEQDVLPDGVRLEHGGTPFTFSADQAIYPGSGYGFVVLFNSCSALGVEQVSFIDGLSAIVSGDQPELGPPASVIADSVLALLTLIALIGGVQQIRRARSWASQRAAAPLWCPALRLGARLIPVALFVELPTLAGLVFGNRDVTWTSSAYGWLALVVWAAAAAVINAAIVAARTFHLAQHRLHERRRNAARSERVAV
jgi:CubicO group peptidase (beta-lactamase class C family)